MRPGGTRFGWKKRRVISTVVYFYLCIDRSIDRYSYAAWGCTRLRVTPPPPKDSAGTATSGTQPPAQPPPSPQTRGVHSHSAPTVLGEWASPHRERQTIPQGQTSSPPKRFLTPTAKARPNQVAIATAAETPDTTHRARPRSPFPQEIEGFLLA